MIVSPSNEHVDLQFESIGVVQVVRMKSVRLDGTKTDAFRNAVADRFEQDGSIYLLNLASLKYMDSRGLGAILSLRKELGDRGELVLCGAVASVARFLQLTRMREIFRIFPTESEALAELHN